MSHVRTIRHAEDWASFCAWFNDHPSPYPFRICEGEGRSLSQNALLHLWLGQIAAQRGDVDANQVKGEMHRRFGLDIRLRNPQFAWVWEQSGAKLDYERQCAALGSGVFGVSSGMSTKELKEYLDALADYAAGQSWVLTMPKEGVTP